MSKDLALTGTGMVAVVLDGERYPLLMSVAAIKEWAEHKEKDFNEVLIEGWHVKEMAGDDLRTMLELQLKYGELRRRRFATDEGREITAELVKEIFALSHPNELLEVLLDVWAEPPAREPDPPRAEE